jgi:uncharacterized protein
MLFKKSKEKKVIALISEHLDLVNEVLKSFSEGIKSHLNNTELVAMNEISFKVHQKEHEADIKRKEIQKAILSGAFLPFYRENFIKIPEMVDEVADLCVGIAQKMYLLDIKYPTKIQAYILQLLDSLLDTYNEFCGIFEYMPDNVDKIVELTEKVSKAETETDSIEWKAKKYIFTIDKELDKVDKNLTSELISEISDIADQIENSADFIFLTMMKMKV